MKFSELIFDEELENLKESTHADEFSLGTAGYILDDGSFIIVDEYHGEDSKYRNEGLPEFSNTHSEEDTCVRIYKEPNEKQYKQLEMIIDKYLDAEGYCKVELWNSPLGDWYYYEIFSLYEGACGDGDWKERIGNWTGYKLVQIIKNKIRKNAWDKSLGEAIDNNEEVEDIDIIPDEEIIEDNVNIDVGDKVSITDNEKGNPWNNKVGTVEYIDDEDAIVLVDFDGKGVRNTFSIDQLSKIEPDTVSDDVDEDSEMIFDDNVVEDDYE